MMKESLTRNTVHVILEKLTEAGYTYTKDAGTYTISENGVALTWHPDGISYEGGEHGKYYYFRLYDEETQIVEDIVRRVGYQ